VLDLAAAFILRGDLQLGNAIMTAHGSSRPFAALRITSVVEGKADVP
jgi:hypothetical protein